MVADTLEIAGPRPPSPLPSNDGGDGIGLGEIFATLNRRRNLLLSTVIGITLLGFIVVKLLTPSFTAQAVLVLKVPHDSVVNMETSDAQLPSPDPETRSESDALQSRALIDRVIERENLMDDPEFNQYAQPFKPNLLTRLHIPDYLPGFLAKLIRSKPLDPDILTPAQLRYNTATFVLKALDVEPDPKTYTTKVNFTSIDAEKAARIANAFVDEYMNSQIDDRQSISDRSAAWIDKRLAQLAENARAATAAVAAFKEAHGIVDLPQSQNADNTLVLQEAQALAQQLVEVRSRRAELEGSVRELEILRSNPDAAVTMPAIANMPLIESLRTQVVTLATTLAQLSGNLGERHPSVIAATDQLQQARDQLSAAAAQAATQVRIQLRQSQSTEGELQGRIADVTRVRSRETNVSPELAQLESVEKAAQSTYDAFVQGYSRALVQDGVPVAKGQVVQYAEVLDWPTFPNVPIFMAVIALAATMIGVAVVYTMEAADTTYRGGAALEAATGVPVFGMTLLVRESWLPTLWRRSKLNALLRRPRVVTGLPVPAAVGSAEAETVGLVRSAISRVRNGRLTKVIMVASALPGEGKSTLALSLAASAVRTGQRALLIEADMRKPSQPAASAINPNFGLAELLRGEATLDEVLIHSPDTGVDIIPASGLTLDAVALLRSLRMRRLILESRDLYDFIVIDTPSVMLVEDALEIDAEGLDAVIVAVKWGGSPRNLVDTAFRRIRAAGLPLIGSVMTQVDAKRYASYGNGRLPIDFAGRYYLVR